MHTCQYNVHEIINKLCPQNSVQYGQTGHSDDSKEAPKLCTCSRRSLIDDTGEIR